MTEPTTRPDPEPEFTETELTAIGAYLPELRRSLSGDRVLIQYLVIGFGVGLAAYVTGYWLRSWAPAEPLGLVTDLLYTLGLALWTGVVVALFVEIMPRSKRHQIERAIQAYEATRSARTSTGPDDTRPG
jgi:hypothetical protein